MEEYKNIFDIFDTPYKVGIHDGICGLPMDASLIQDKNYIKGYKEGEKSVEELNPKKEKISIYLDDAPEDIRITPNGWIRCRWPEEVIELLKQGNVETISLDHDLGETGIGARTGYDVLTWLEEKVFTEDFIPPKIIIHTGSPAARQRMVQAVKKIEDRAKLIKYNITFSPIEFRNLIEKALMDTGLQVKSIEKITVHATVDGAATVTCLLEEEE